MKKGVPQIQRIEKVKEKKPWARSLERSGLDRVEEDLGLPEGRRGRKKKKRRSC
jgi:hypothetical protein